MSERLEVKTWNLLKLQRYQQQNQESLVRMGIATWKSAKLRGTLYDHNTPIDEFLSMYAAQYDAVEDHDSFIDIPSIRRMEALRRAVENVNENFKFCPLIPRRISHEFELGENLFDLKEFVERVGLLGNHLGPCILRLPETFSPLKYKVLLRFLKHWAKELRLAIHFTQENWFKSSSNLKVILKEIRGSRISVLIEDRIEFPVNIEELLSSDYLVVRFFGRAKLNRDEERLALWVYKLSEYQGYGVKNPYFLLYEQEEMTLGILRKVGNSLGGKVRVPQGFNINSKQLGFLF